MHAGTDVKIQIDLNGVGSGGTPNWATIAQQRGGSLALGADVADASNKDDDGWQAGVITRNNWSVSGDGALLITDTALTYMIACVKNKTKVYLLIKWSDIGGTDEEGKAIITALNRDFPEGDMISYTAEFQGDGELD